MIINETQKLIYLDACNIIMKSSEFNDFLAKGRIRVFRLADAARIIGKDRRYAALFLSRNSKIKSAVGGIYYTEDATEYDVASRIVYPSYVSLISALRFHNLTEQMPRIIYVLSYKRHRPVPVLNGFSVEFKEIKREMMYGYGRVDGVFVASPEKAVIDMLYLNEFVEYAEEAIDSGKLDYGLLEGYAVRSGVKTLEQRVKKLRSKTAISVIA